MAPSMRDYIIMEGVVFAHGDFFFGFYGGKAHYHLRDESRAPLELAGEWTGFGGGGRLGAVFMGVARSLLVVFAKLHACFVNG